MKPSEIFNKYYDELAEKERNHKMKKIRCKTYSSNATISDGEITISVYYNSDECDGFTAEEYWKTIKEQICDEFGEDIDPSSMLDTELKIMAHLEEICAQ